LPSLDFISEHTGALFRIEQRVVHWSKEETSAFETKTSACSLHFIVYLSIFRFDSSKLNVCFLFDRKEEES